ncbi:MAG: hypothetical protein C1O27_001878 [Chloroflexi bacterium]|jgi:uncharacterized OB-fold protein|nr:MAG: hypothetical protein C1O27_001878 [Chloroflexota bacterium]
MTNERVLFTAEAFYAHLKEQRLMGSRCVSCGELYLPPRPICVSCGGKDMTWHPFQGNGRLSTFTCIRVAPSAMEARGYGRNTPYCTGLVETDEGPTISALVLGVDAARPEMIQVGMALQVDFSEATGDHPALAFHAV